MTRPYRFLLAAILVASAGRPGELRGQAALAARLHEIRQSSRSGDHSRALHLVDSLLAGFPDHPGVVLGAAVARASAGHSGEASGAVARLLRWDPRYARRALGDSALARLRPAFADVAARAAAADTETARAEIWATLNETDLVPEGTAWDPGTRSVLIGSLNKSKIVAISPEGRVEDRVPSGAHRLGSVAGIHVDSIRRALWVTSNRRYDRPEDTTTAALYRFDPLTGAFRSRHDAPERNGHFFNDLTTGSDGTVYLTDTDAGRVWLLRPDAAALEPFAAAGELTAPNGITASPEGRHLFIADIDHVRVVPLTGGAPWRLGVPDSINLAGIDGLAFADGALIAHHPLAFWRVARYPLDAGYRAVTGREVLEANTPDGRTSTTGEVAGDWYVFIGNSQIDRMNLGTIDSTTMDPVRMYRFPLSRRGRRPPALRRRRGGHRSDSGRSGSRTARRGRARRSA